MKERPILFSAPMVRALLADTKTQTRRALRKQPWESWCIEAGMAGDSPFVYSSLSSDGAGHDVDETRTPCICPYGAPGDRLWVRETFFAFGRWETRFNAKKGRDEWHFVDTTGECDRRYVYAAEEIAVPVATVPRGWVNPHWWKRPAIFMPRVGSRVTLEVTGVCVEQLQAISEADALAEGVRIPCTEAGRPLLRISGRPTASSFNAKHPRKWALGDYARFAYAELWEDINGAGSWDANPWVWVVEFKRI